MANTPKYSLYYPTTSDTVQPASRDLRDMQTTVEAALNSIEVEASARWNRVVPTGANLDDMRTPAHSGGWNVPTAEAAAELTGGRPPLPGPFHLDVKYVNQAAWQTAYSGGNGSVRSVVRRKYSPLSPSAGWSPWEPDSGGSAGSQPSTQWTPHRKEMLLQASKLRRGGGRGIGEKTAVALSFDHGFANYRDFLLPHLIRLGLPHSVAVNPGTLGAGESSGVNLTLLQEWCLKHGVELVNHAVSHADAVTVGEQEAAILGALETVRSGAPKAVVDSFIMPGVSGTGYDGFNAGLPPEKWWTHPVGRMILDNHAVVTSALLGQAMPMSGTPTQTIDRAGFDSGSWATIVQNRIASLNGTGLGIQIFNHPSTIGTGITETRVVQLLEWLAAERDAGRIEVLTVSGFAWAQYGTDRKVDISRGAWSGGTATVALAPLIEWARGGQWQLIARSSENATVSMSVADDTGALLSSKASPVLSGATARLNFSIPSDSSSLTFTVSATSGNLSELSVTAI